MPHLRQLLRRQPARYVKWCYVFLQRNGSVALVASTFNHAGYFAEKPGGVSESSIADPTGLGELVIQKLDECEFQAEFDYSRQKRRDQPAFRASRCKTLKEFERDFVSYAVQGANEYNIIYLVQSADMPNQIRLQASFSSGTDPTAIGALLTDFHRFFQRAEALSRK